MRRKKAKVKQTENFPPKMIIFHIALLYISQIFIIGNTMRTCPMSQDYFHASYLFFIRYSSFLFAFGSIMSVALHCKSACMASQKYINMHFNRLPQTHTNTSKEGGEVKE